MALLVAFAAGALLGWRRARQGGGDRLDQLQFAAGYGIAVTLVALVLIILGQRLGVI